MGQQQRVAIARALAHEPLLILADEPTGELDQETATEVLDYLMTPVRQKKITLIVATHGVFPIRFADRLCDLKEGLIRKSAISHSHFPKHAHTFKNRQKRNLP
jgi:putative ABC transport system ATP-binding protein